MNNFRPHAMSRQRPHYTFSCQTPNPDCVPGASHWYGVVPDDLQTIYGMAPLYAAGISGAGQTIVVLEDSDVFDPADWSTFRKTFGLSQRFPKGTFAQVNPQPPPGSTKGAACEDPGPFGDDFEAILDAEWASAAAPNARILLASCVDTPTNLTSGVVIALQNLLASRGPMPAIVSDSFGGGESENGPSYNAYIRSLYEVAVLQGVSLFVASGDGGADDDNVDLFALGAEHGVNAIGLGSTPYNVSVGGTDFADTYLHENSKYWRNGNNRFYGSALTYIPEIPWNASCASQLNASFFGFPKSYGVDGFCNAFPNAVVSSVAASGAPSGCAYGAPRVPGVVGGTCKGYEKPVWQRWVRGNPHDGVRDVPDVSLFASNGTWGHYYVVCYSNSMPGYFGRSCQDVPSQWAGGGGTSFASPVMAGIQALVNEATEQRQGNPNFVYYALAALEYDDRLIQGCDATLGSGSKAWCLFHDVTLGDNDVDCSPLTDANGTRVGMFNCYSPGGDLGVMSESNSHYEPLFKAGPGWDFATGLGSVNAYNLVRAWPGSKLRK
jgi:subtilase family serine protease